MQQIGILSHELSLQLNLDLLGPLLIHSAGPLLPERMVLPMFMMPEFLLTASIADAERPDQSGKRIPEEFDHYY